MLVIPVEQDFQMFESLRSKAEVARNETLELQQHYRIRSSENKEGVNGHETNDLVQLEQRCVESFGTALQIFPAVIDNICNQLGHRSVNLINEKFDELVAIWSKLWDTMFIIRLINIQSYGPQHHTFHDFKSMLEFTIPHLLIDQSQQWLFAKLLKLFNTFRHFFSPSYPNQSNVSKGFLANSGIDSTIPPSDLSLESAQQILFDTMTAAYASASRVRGTMLKIYRFEQKRSMLGIGLALPQQNRNRILKDAEERFQFLAKIAFHLQQLVTEYRNHFAGRINFQQHMCCTIAHILQCSTIVDLWEKNERYLLLQLRADSKKKHDVKIVVHILAASPRQGSITLHRDNDSSRLITTLNQQRKKFAEKEFDEDTKQNIAFDDETCELLMTNNAPTTLLMEANSFSKDVNIAEKQDIRHYMLEYTNVAVSLRSRKETKLHHAEARSKIQRYHFEVAMQFTVRVENNAFPHEIKTISTPFTCDVVKNQKDDNYESLFWGLLASEPASYSTFNVAWGDHIVPWAMYREALSGFFHRLTGSRTLYHDELDHISKGIIAKKKKLTQQQQPQQQPSECIALPQWYHFSYNQLLSSKFGEGEGFFKWFYKFVDLVADGLGDGDVDNDNGREGNASPMGGNKRLQNGAVKSGKDANKKLAQLVRERTIFGFTSRATATDLLTRAAIKKETAMLIRFSDHHAGELPVSYYTNGTVDHIQPFTMGTRFNHEYVSDMVLHQVKNLQHVHYVVVGVQPNGEPITVRKEQLFVESAKKRHASIVEDVAYDYNWCEISPAGDDIIEQAKKMQIIMNKDVNPDVLHSYECFLDNLKKAQAENTAGRSPAAVYRGMVASPSATLSSRCSPFSIASSGHTPSNPGSVHRDETAGMGFDMGSGMSPIAIVRSPPSDPAQSTGYQLSPESYLPQMVQMYDESSYMPPPPTPLPPPPPQYARNLPQPRSPMSQMQFQHPQQPMHHQFGRQPQMSMGPNMATMPVGNLGHPYNQQHNENYVITERTQQTYYHQQGNAMPPQQHYYGDNYPHPDHLMPLMPPRQQMPVHGMMQPPPYSSQQQPIAQNPTANSGQQQTYQQQQLPRHMEGMPFAEGNRLNLGKF